MAKIKIEDLPNDQKVSVEEMKKVIGGGTPQPDPPNLWLKRGFDVFHSTKMVDQPEIIKR